MVTVILSNAPDVWTVLSVDSWNYCFGQQGPTAEDIRKAVQSS